MKPTRLNLTYGIAWLTCVLTATSHAALNIPDVPIFLTSTGVPPNIVLTLDDSGSMARAYTPDLCGASMLGCNSTSESQASDDYHLATRSAKSSYKNPMYYNPNVIYRAPVNAAGTALAYGPDPTNYPMRAYINGYYTAAGYVDLDTSYRATAWYWLGASDPGQATAGPKLMNHYASDARCSTSNRCQYLNASASWTNSPNTTACGYRNSYCQTNAVMPAYYYNLDTSNAGCNINNTPGTSGYEACFDIVAVGSNSGPGTKDLNGDGLINNSDKDERANFARWYAFYRTRNLATVGAASLAFDSLTEDATKVPRVAWQSLNTCRGSNLTGSFVNTSCRGWDGTVATVSNTIKPFIANTSGGNKDSFYQWLLRLPGAGGTPLRTAFIRAGWYFSQGGDGSPYDNDFATANSDQYSCRRNFHIAMTDGLWNQGNNTETSDLSGIGDEETTFTINSSTVAAGRPYEDSNSDTISDIAFKYWKTDLRQGANDSLPLCTPSQVASGNTSGCCTGATCNSLSKAIVDRVGDSTYQYKNPKNNPATWQHMVNYTVGLGLSGFLSQSGLTWGGDTYSGSYSSQPNNLLNTIDWPTANATDQGGQGAVGNVADLWHAALDSRGRFYNVDSPDKLVDAFQEIVNTISAGSQGTGGGAGLAVSNSIIREPNGSTVIYQATFDDTDWSGKLQAIPFQGSTGTMGTAYWDAGQRIPTTANRKIFTLNGASKEAFSSCSGTLASALNGMNLDNNASTSETNRCSNLLNWLRSSWLPATGSITSASWSSASSGTATFSVPNHEFVTGDAVSITGVSPAGYNGTYTVTVSGNSLSVSLGVNPGTYVSGGKAQYASSYSGAPYATYRNRGNTALGDIANSDLVYSKNEDYGYATGNAPGQNTYAAYVTAKASRTPVVYAGANDGMLHAFNASVGSTTPDSDAEHGKELFAYVPNGVYGNLGLLPFTGYSHKFYVNGKITVGDAYISSWKTYLVGALGKGGQSIYALDVTDPVNFSASNIAWEYTEADLGYTFGKPQIAPLKDGNWAAIFGNGYNSTGGKAVLYIVNLATGALIKKLDMGSGSNNGLSTPYLYDSDGDKVVDAVYAGDIQGNMWKFDLSSSSSGSWSGRKLFAAGSTQPITSPPNVTSHPTRGVLVLFGTGRYVSTDDLTNTDQQAFYGIWDDPTTSDTVPKASLLQQTITEEATNAGILWRVTSNNAINWSTQRGWYINMPASTNSDPAERMVNTPLVIDARNGGGYLSDAGKQFWRVIFTTTIVYDDPCARGGTGWIMELDLYTGGRPQVAVLDYNNDDSFDNSDYRGAVDTNSDGTISDAERIASGGVPVTGKKLGDDGVPGDTTLIDFCPPGEECKQYKETAMSTGSPHQTKQNRPPEGIGNPVRIYWQQIL